VLNVKKIGKSDMDVLNPCGNWTKYAKQFTYWMEGLNLNVANYAYKCKKACTTFETRPTICI
jgi:hypothetical protein